MYILIFEDGIIRKSDKLNDDDIIGVEDGYLDIIDTLDPLKPLICIGQDSWVEVANV